MAIKALTMIVALLMIILPIVCAMFWGCKMDIAAIEELVTSLGFPIACVIALAYFAFYVVDKSSKQNKTNMEMLQERCIERENKLYKEIEENRKINDKAIETITKYADRLDNIQRDIDEIRVDVVRIVDRIQ